MSKIVYPKIAGIEEGLPDQAGQSGKYLTTNGTTSSWSSISGGTPSGADTNVQYNDGGAFGADSNNTWNKTTKLSTLTNAGIATTITSSQLIQNTTAATSGVPVQQSPAIQWRGYGRRTSSGGSSRSVDFYSYGVPSTGASEVIGEWRLDYSLNGAAASRGLQYFTNVQDGVSIPKLKVNGFAQVAGNNSSTIDTLSSFDFLNPSGSRINITGTFNTTIRWGIQIQDGGATYYKSAGSGAQHTFQVGSTIGSVADALQITSVGLYNYGGSFNQGKVTAGQADTSPPGYLTTFGSFAGRGTLITASTYTLTENDFVLYGDASSAFLCSGTPSVTACSTYSGAGSATCTSHLPCVWSDGSPCSDFSGNESGCTSASGCSWDTASCLGAGDSTACTDQNTTYGGSCSWDTSTCSGFSSTASCTGQSGCSADVSSDCSSLSDGGGDGTSCGTQPECSYDSGTGACSGSYFTSCSGEFCSGTYNTGGCSGTYGAGCSGTVTCSSYSSSGPCVAETGCSASTGSTWTLPTSDTSNEGNTSRFHYLKNIGASGTITVSAGSGDTLESSISLTAGQGALVHHYKRTANCDVFTTEGTCTPSGCGWSPLSCSGFGDESTCNAASGCSWNGSSCDGTYSGSGGSCAGTYQISSKWYKHATI